MKSELSVVYENKQNEQKLRKAQMRILGLHKVKTMDLGIKEWDLALSDLYQFF